MVTSPEGLIARGSPFELLEADLEGMPCRIFRYAPKTLNELYGRAEFCAAREFLVSARDRLTYRELFQRAAAVSKTLVQQCKAREGIKIAIVMNNTPEWIIGFVAVTSIGATAVTIHRESPVSEILFALNICECSLVICDKDVTTLLTDNGYQRPTVHIGGDAMSMYGPSVVDSPNGNARWVHRVTDTVPETLAIIAFTSGSTGRPKGVELTHRGMLCGLMNMLLGGALSAAGASDIRKGRGRSPPVSLIVAPFSHIGGYSSVLLMMYLGGKIATMDCWDTEVALQLMEAESVTSLVGATPEMIKNTLRADRIVDAARSLRSVNIYGTALQPGLLNEIRRTLPEVSVGTGYGMTETNGSVCVSSGSTLMERPASAGRPLPTVDLRIVRDDGSDAALGETGEVTLRGAMIMRGYCNCPEATQQTLQRGWLRTGDIGWLDGDGFLYIVDRLSDVVVCNGSMVSCSAVEGLVLDKGLAEQVAAFWVEDAQQGQRLVVALTHRGDFRSDDEEIVELIAAAGFVGRTKPQIVYLPSLPHTVSGKIDKHKLRRSVLAQAGIVNGNG